MKYVPYIAWVGGLGFLAWLIVHQGIGDIAHTVGESGAGVLWISLFHLGPLLVYTLGWRTLLWGERPGFGRVFTIRWIGESVNVLLPVAHVGGDVVRAGLLSRSAVPGAVAAASVVADVTAGLVTEVLFVLLGLFFLFQEDARTALPVLIAIAIFALILGGFYVAQRKGLFERATGLLARRIGGEKGFGVVSRAAALDGALARIYRSHRRFLACCAWRAAGWVLGAGEVYLALIFLGHPVSLGAAIMMESIGQGVRSAAFLVPGAIGLQEGGFILLGKAAGLGPDVGLSMALLKRGRELLLGIPGLLWWQAMEGKRLWSARRKVTPGGGPEGKTPS